MIAAMLIAAISTPAFSGQIVAPQPFSGTEGSNSSSGVLLGNSRTLQYVYSTSELGFSAGSELAGLAFRLNNSQGTNVALTWTNYTIELSQSLFAPGSLSTVFANNIGADVVTVRSGPLAIAASAFPSGGSPNAFGPEIVFTTPYTYTGGDLLVTIRHTGNTQGIGYFADSVPNATGLYEGQGAAGFATASFTAGQSVTNTAVVMQFDVAPEPGTWVLAGSLVALLAAGRRLRRRRTERVW